MPDNIPLPDATQDAMDALKSLGNVGPSNADTNDAMEALNSLGGNTGQPTEPKPQADSAAVSALKAGAESIGPGAAALAGGEAGGEAGAAIGSFVGPVGTFVGGLIGGAGGAALAAGTAAWAQHKAAQALAPDFTQKWDQQQAANEEVHPVASAVGRIASALPMFEFDPKASVDGVSALVKAARAGGMHVLSDAEKEAAQTTAIQVGFGTGQSVVQPLLMGQSPTLKDVSEAFVQSLILGKPRYDLFGAHTEKSIAADQAAKDDQAEKDKAGNPVSTYDTSKPDDLTPDDRGKLSIFAAKVAAGAKLDASDVALRAKFLNGDNPDAEKFFDKSKQEWSAAFVARAAEAAKFQEWHEQYGDAYAAHAAGLETPPKPAGETAPTETPPATTAPTPAADHVADAGKMVPTESSPEPSPEPVTVSTPVVTPPVAETVVPSAPAPISGFNPPPLPEHFDSEQQFLDYRNAYKQSEINFYKSLGMSDSEAGKFFRAGDSRSNVDVSDIEDKLSPENKARLDTFSRGEGEAQPVYQWDKSFNPEQVASETDKTELARALVENIGKGGTSEEFGDKPIHASIALRRLQKAGGTWSDIAKALDGYTTRNSSTQGDKAEYFKSLGYKLKEFAEKQGVHLAQGELGARLSGGEHQPLSLTKEEAPKNEPAVTQPPPVQSGPEWQKFQGDPQALLDRFRNNLEAGRGQLVGQERGKGKKGGALLEEKTNESDKDFLAKLDTTAKSSEGKKLVDKNMSPTMLAMQAPDGSHVRLSTFYRANGKEYVSTTSGKGENIQAQLDKGWKIVGALKGEPTKGKVETYSPDQWRGAAKEMREFLGSAKRTAEAQSAHFAAAKEFDRENEGEPTELAQGSHVPLADDHPTGDAATETPEAADEKPTGSRDFTTEHADALASAFEGVPAERLKSPAEIVARLKKAGPDAIEAYSVMVRNASDAGLTPEDAVQYCNRKIYEAQAGSKNSGTSSKRLAESFRFGGSEEPNQSLGSGQGAKPVDSNNSAGAAPTVAERGAGGTGTGAEPNPEGASRGVVEKPAAAERPADKPAPSVEEPKPPKVEYVSERGLSKKDLSTAEGIAESYAREQGYDSQEAVDAHVEDLMQRPILARVNGKIGMLIDGDIHFANGETIQPPPDFLANVGKFRTQQAEKTVKQIRSTPAQIANRFKAAVQNLRNLGVAVDAIIDPLAKHFSSGAYKGFFQTLEGVGQLIQLHIADSDSPTIENLVTLFHEAGHAIFAQLQPEQQAMLHKAIQAFTNEQLGIGEYKESVGHLPLSQQAGANQEGRLVEALARKFVTEGFDPAQSPGMAQKIWEGMKQVVRGVLMAIQKMAGRPVNEEMAMKWFQHRMETALRGESPMSFLNFMGGPTVKPIDWDNLNEAQSSARYRINPTTNPEGLLHDRDTAPLGIAVLNHFFDAVKKQSADWEIQSVNGLKADDVLKRLMKFPTDVDGSPLFRPGVGPQQLIEGVAKLHGITPETRIDDLPNGIAKARAQVMAHRLLSEWKAVMDGELSEKRGMLKRDGTELEHGLTRREELMKKYTDKEYMGRSVRDSMLGLLKGARDAFSGIRNVAFKGGMLDQTIRQLAGIQENGEIPQPAKKAINELFDRLTRVGRDNDGEIRFADTLQHVANLDIDWEKVKTTDCAEAIRQEYLKSKNPLLEPMLRDSAESRALMATVIAYAKSNEHMMDLLATRMEHSQDDLTKVNGMLKALTDAGESDFAGLKDRIIQMFDKNLPLMRRMLRLADQISRQEKTNKALEKAIQANQEFVDFHKQVFDPDVTTKLKDLEAKAGLSVKRFEVVDGAKVPVPSLDPEKPNAIDYRTLKLKTEVGKKGDVPTLNSETIGWLQKMYKWLADPANKKTGATYNEVAEAAEMLKNRMVETEHANMRYGFIMRWLAPLQERAAMVGTAAARHIGVNFTKYTAHIVSTRQEVQGRGMSFETAAIEAAKLGGYHGTDWHNWFNAKLGPVLSNLEMNGAKIFMRAKSEDEAVKFGVEHALAQMNLKSPAEKAAVARVLEMGIRNNDWLVKTGAENGLKVYDPYGNGKGVYRPVLGKSPFVWARALKAQAEDFYRTHMLKTWGKALKAKDIVELYEQDPNLLRQSLTDKFSPEVWGWFMRSIVHNDKVHFYQPGEGDVRPLADRQTVIDAYNESKDPVTFAENLSRAYGHPPDAGYVAETLDVVQQFHNLLQTMCGDEAETVRKGNPQPSRMLVDARHVEAAPKEWMEYLPPDRHNLTRITQSQASQIAFGRNGEAMNRLIATAKNEQSEAMNQFKSITDDVKQNNPKMSEGQRQKAIKEACVARGLDYEALSNARTNLDSINAIEQHYTNICDMGRAGKIPELMPWSMLLKAISSGTVSGAGTAITAHSVSWEQPVRLLGITPRALSLTAHMTVDLAKVMANSVFQAFGHQVVFEADKIAMANRLGFIDPLNSNTERFAAASAQARGMYAGQNWVNRMVGKIGGLGESLFQTDAFAPGARDKAQARLEQGQAVAPTVKILSPFHWVAESLRYANFVAWMRHYESMVMAGVEHFNQHPDALEDKGFTFTRKQIADAGFAAGDKEWKMLTDQMSRRGLTFEMLARDAFKRQNEGKPVISDDFGKAIQQLVLDEVTLESSLTSRTPSLQTSTLGTAMNPFLGWPLQKTYQVMRHIREPNGQASWKATRAGIMAYAAILPIGMAFAWLRNKFDEDVLGRKQNISDLGNIHDAKSAMMTMLDNASRVGTFGLIGEGANEFLSNDNIRPLSVDNRVFFVNTAESVWKAAGALYHQAGPQLLRGDVQGAENTATDYQTTIRPLFQALGGNGALQNLGAINHLMGLDDAESRVANRISVNNYLRVAGRELNMDVRSYAGMMQTATEPNPLKPLVGQMVMASYANDSKDFNQTYKEAIREAVSEGMTHDEAQKKVASLFAAQNPLRVVFAHSLTEAELHKLGSALPDQGKASVQQALRLFDHYGQQIGANTSAVAKPKPTFPTRTTIPSSTLDRLRDMAISHGNTL